MTTAISQAIENMAHLKNAPKGIPARHATAMAFEREIRAKGYASDEQIAAACQYFAAMPSSSEFPGATAFASRVLGVSARSKIGITCYVAVDGTAYAMDRERAGRDGYTIYSTLEGAEAAAYEQWRKLNPIKAKLKDAWTAAEPSKRSQVLAGFVRRKSKVQGLPDDDQTEMTQLGGLL